MNMTTDPLLKTYQLKHLTLRNRLMSSVHVPGYIEDRMPKERYRLYHQEKVLFLVDKLKYHPDFYTFPIDVGTGLMLLCRK